jgi:hypothetical protein
MQAKNFLIMALLCTKTHLNLDTGVEKELRQNPSAILSDPLSDINLSMCKSISKQ